MEKICGIYKLEFNGTNKVYIGLSKDVYHRFKQHLYSMQKGTHSTKLMEAYNTYGEPNLVVLETCEASSLEERELFYILKYNSRLAGFNTAPYSYYVNETPVFVDKGKFDKSEYEVMFLAIYEIRSKYGYLVSLEALAAKLEVPINILKNISRCLTHRWLKQEYPEEYRFMEEMLDNYKPGVQHIGIGKLGKYPPLQDKYGTVYTIDGSLIDFCKLHNLNSGNLSRVINGKLATHKGFRLLSTKLPRKWVIFNAELNLSLTLLEGEINKTAEIHGITSSNILAVLNGKRKSANGWVLISSE